MKETLKSLIQKKTLGLGFLGYLTGTASFAFWSITAAGKGSFIEVFLWFFAARLVVLSVFAYILGFALKKSNEKLTSTNLFSIFGILNAVKIIFAVSAFAAILTGLGKPVLYIGFITAMFAQFWVDMNIITSLCNLPYSRCLIIYSSALVLGIAAAFMSLVVIGHFMGAAPQKAA